MTNQTKQLFSKRHRLAVLISLMATAGIYLAVVMITGYEQALEAIKRLGIYGWLVLLACSFFNYSLRYGRWQYYLRHTGWQLNPRLHFLYYLSAFALTTTPGKAGETIRSVLLRPHGVPYHTSLACFFTERFLDLMVVALLALLVIVDFTDINIYISILTILLVGMLPLLRSQYLTRLIQYWQKVTPPTRVGKLLGHIFHMFLNAQEFMSTRLLSAGLLLGTIAWSIQGLAFYFILQQLGFDISLTSAMGIYAVSLLAGALSFIPGGIGSTEVTMGILLATSGADSSVTITAPLISRLSTLWFAVILGLVATGMLGLQRKYSA